MFSKGLVTSSILIMLEKKPSTFDFCFFKKKLVSSLKKHTSKSYVCTIKPTRMSLSTLDSYKIDLCDNMNKFFLVKLFSLMWLSIIDCQCIKKKKIIDNAPSLNDFCLSKSLDEDQHKNFSMYHLFYYNYSLGDKLWTNLVTFKL